MKWITSTEGKVEGRGNNRPKPSTEAQTPLEKQQSQHLSDVQDVLSLCFSCSIVSLVGSGFFSLVSVFFSLVLSNVSISAKSGLSDMVGPVSQRVTSGSRRRYRWGPPAGGGAFVRRSRCGDGRRSGRQRGGRGVRRRQETERGERRGGGGPRGERSGEERPAPAPGVGRGGGTCRCRGRRGGRVTRQRLTAEVLIEFCYSSMRNYRLIFCHNLKQP